MSATRYLASIAAIVAVIGGIGYVYVSDDDDSDADAALDTVTLTDPSPTAALFVVPLHNPMMPLDETSNTTQHIDGAGRSSASAAIAVRRQSLTSRP